MKRALLEQRAQFFKKESQYRTYLRKSKRTEADLYAGMEQKLLMDKLLARAVRESPPIDDARVAQYYEKNKKEFALPERYEVRTLIAKTEEKANQAKQAVADGKSWKQALEAYGPKDIKVAESAKARVLAETGVKELDAALAKAKPGDRIVVKTQYGSILVGVERVLAAKQQTLDQVRGQIRERLVGSRREDASNAFLQAFQNEYKDKSVCASGYKVAACSNGPDENPKPKPPERAETVPDDPGRGSG